MNNKQSTKLNGMKKTVLNYLFVGIALLLMQIPGLQAGELELQGLDFTKLAGGKLQLQLEMNGPVIQPKVFHTDNPARIALDFVGVKSKLAKKKYPINLGAADSVYVAESGDRVRVVINLIAPTPYETIIDGNKLLVTLTESSGADVPAAVKPVALPEATKQARKAVVAKLIPEQGIRGLDFKRGPNGEGRILVALAKPNTMVNTKEIGGKIVLNFVNTRLPERLSKRLDVSEFATPVKYIDAVSSRSETTLTIEMQNSLYDYSLFQAEGLLTVEFRPLTSAEKEVLDSKRNKYSGNRLSLNFQNIDIRSVITLLAEFTGQNVVAGEDVSGGVTLKLDDVPWDEALDFIMMTKNLEKYQTGNVTLIAPIGKIKEYKEKQRETEKVVEQLEPLQTEYIRINYARAENFRNLLYGSDTGAFGTCGIASGSGSGGGSNFLASPPQQMAGQNVNISGASSGGGGGQGGLQNDEFRLISARGTAIVDARTNTLIVRETAARLEEIRKLIKRLDVQVRQVMIESRIVIATNDFAKEMGVKFGAAKMGQAGSGKSFAIGGGGTRSFSNAQADDSGNIGEVQDLLVDLGAAVGAGSGGSLAMTLVRGADYVLNLELSALQDEGRGELISNPRVMTSDRCQATIKQGDQIAYQIQTQDGPQTQLVDAVLELNVTPQITPSGTIVMDLVIKKDQPVAPISGTLPMIQKKEVKTNVHVMDGETIVLGGIYEGTTQNTTNKVPFFADLPGIGFLFRKNFELNNKTELLIFVTPKIVSDNVTTN